MNQLDPNNDRDRRLIGLLDDAAAPVNHDALAALRELTLRELTKSESEFDNRAKTEEQTSRVSMRRVDLNIEGRNMFTLATRAVVSLVVVVVTGAVWFMGGDAAAEMTLGSVLDRIQSAETLQLQVVRDGQTANVWIRDDGQLRWEESKSEYVIANGTSLWEIDESTNTVMSREDELLASAAADVDLLALLGVGGSASSELRRARAGRVVEHDGAKCRVYRATTSVDGRALEFEAYVAESSRELKSIAAWPAGMRRKVPPVAELRLIARNAPVNEELFVVGKTLSQDGRIGNVTDQQGIVLLRPKLRQRWTPVARRVLLKPGDQLRTDVRGANAALVTLTSGVKVTIGPGTLLELSSPTKARLYYGEAQVDRAGYKGAFTLATFNGPYNRIEPKKPTLFRAGKKGEFETVAKKPMWLRGFEGLTSNESIGSLITKVDNRDVKLTIGYHKVRVEIRDQIARTTIEESFVNHTNRRLEGVFHFPLPQDASISGFGMWIGGELVEADVVEKQRAREIYETILRERRDPGLLEWTGGNIFKARVFPIEARSEKRIKIVYTQVLPLRANQYRYSYALRSEMLQKTPLRELSIDVLVNSAVPLKSVSSPTHPARTELTGGSARLQFSAQEYTPTKDFEVVCEIDGRASDVVTIPHRRGDDGYFMVQLMPPAANGDWKRELLPDGAPIDLLLVCDTSGSMDKDNRKRQAELVSAMLSSLGPDDRFNLAVTDVDCQWLFDKSAAPDEANITKAQDWLAERYSLGWTDLDRMMASVVKKAKDGSHVVYIGDGVVSAHDADPQAFAARVRDTYGKNSRGTFHAVSTGSSFESGVLKAIASVGRGSVRQISGGDTSQSVALELLNEISQPGLRDINVRFEGLTVGAVYPKQLPNLAAGTQQILIGRYLPTGNNQSGKIIVTGKRGGEEVTYSARMPLKDAESGNSFVPRLWARAHLDQLLQQGRSTRIKDEIIALSEEFHIMTPYTSLLVLETDADRERFGVKRRFNMRDGERFFADGRDNVKYDLLQKVTREAGNWRIGLRNQVLRQLAGLGRDQRMAQQVQQIARQAQQLVADVGDMAERWDVSLTARLGQKNKELAGRGFGEIAPFEHKEAESLDQLRHEVSESKSREITSLVTEVTVEERLDDEEWPASEEDHFKGTPSPLPGDHPFPDAPFEPFSGGENGKLMQFGGEFDEKGADKGQGGLRWEGDRRYRGETYHDQYISWIDEPFPHLPRATPKRQPNVKTDWPKEAVELSKGLLRREWLSQIKGGVEIRQTGESFAARWNRKTGQTDSLQLASAKQWLAWSVSGGGNKIVHWANADERGVFAHAFGLGRIRKSQPTDLEANIDIGRFTQRALHEAYATYEVELSDVANGLRVITLTSRNNKSYQQRFTIDVNKLVVVKAETVRDGKLRSATTWSGLTQVGGAWWPTKSETVDDKGRKTTTQTTTIRELTVDKFAARMTAELKPREQMAFMRMPMPSVEAAEQAAVAGEADFNDRLVLVARFCLIQKWDDVFKHFAEMEKLLADKPAATWLRLSLLVNARRFEDARHLILAEAERLKQPRTSDLAQARHLVNRAWQCTSAQETSEVLNKLKPTYERQPKHSSAMHDWRGQQLRAFRNSKRFDEALALQKQMAELRPWDVYSQTAYARALVEAGDLEAAYQWLQQELDRDINRTEHERNELWGAWSDKLREVGDASGLLAVVEKWLEEEPNSDWAYKRYLTALVFDDQLDRAGKTARQWMLDARVDGKLDRRVYSKLAAAVEFATGEGWYLSWHLTDPRWLEPLQATALFFLNHEHHFDIAQRIMNRSQFTDSDEGDALREAAMDLLIKQAGTLHPHKLNNYINWVRPIPRAQSRDTWQPVVAALRTRWANTQTDERRTLGDTIRSIYQRYFPGADELAFMRERFGAATGEGRDDFALQLFDRLLSEPWTQELETELFGLLAEIGKSKASTTQVAQQIAAEYRLFDRMLESRFEASKNAFEANPRDFDLEPKVDAGGGVSDPKKLTRSQRAAKIASMKTDAKIGLAARLADEADKHESVFADWLRMEKMYLDVTLNRRLDQVARDCQRIFGDAPPKPKELGNKDEKQPVKAARTRDAIDSVVRSALRHRALITVANLAVRKSAKPELRKWLAEYVEAGCKSGANSAAAWKQTKANLLIALDEPEQLERAIRTWMRTDKDVTGWQRLLARLLAEQGKFDEAIRLFKDVQRDSQLSSADYRALATWYLVTDKRDEYVQAKIDSLKYVREYQLSEFIRRRVNRWEDRTQPLPSELDEQVLIMFQALFEKSNSPGSYLWQLRDFYRACRDFRLLNMLPDSMIGRSQQQVYSFLKQVRDTVLQDLREEATADEILNRIAELRKRDLSPLDLRALDLLEFSVERKSAKVLNQPGPHAAAAIAAMQRAFRHGWADGERIRMGSLLYGLGKITNEQLAAEQIRELRELLRQEEAGSRDRLFIGWYLAHTLFWSYERRAEAMQIMEVVVREYEQSYPDGWPQPANVPLDSYIKFFEATGQHATAEQFLKRHLQNPRNSEQRRWLTERLMSVYASAFENGSRVSLGEGTELYVNLRKHIINLAEQADEYHRYQIIQRLHSLFKKAAEKKVTTVKADVRDYAFNVVPELIETQTNYYYQIISEAADTVHDLVDKRAGLEFLLDRMEHFPKRSSVSWQSYWSHFSYRLGQWQRDVKDIGNLEPRLLKLVLSELRRDLTTRSSRNRYLYAHNGFYWAEKEADFLKVTENVLAKHSKSRRHVRYVAEFIWHGLRKRNRAIEILFVANKAGLLQYGDRITLVSWLFQEERFAESIPLLEGLVQRQPMTMNQRCNLITAYTKTSRLQQRTDLVRKTEELFRDGHWTESNLSQLAACCRQNSLNRLAVLYFNELIPLHQRSAPNRGIGNGTLSNYYRSLSAAHQQLGNTVAAVDAASAAIVSWGSHHEQREDAVNHLRNVIGSSKELDEFVAHVDKGAEKTKEDSPIIRYAIGKAYADRKEHATAIKHFRIAVELQPTDTTTHTSLLKSYDALGDQESAVKQVLQLLDFDRHNLEQYRELARRLANDDAQAERAATSLVESAPNEAEHHQALAELREVERRWPAAIAHWKKVAELRALEPGGLFGLCRAQIEGKQTDAARQTLEQITTTKWASRFDRLVRDQTAKLKRRLP